MPLPSDMPIMGMLVSVGRRLSGELSAVSAITLGSTPPRPMPVRKRRMPSCRRFSASRQASDISAYSTVPHDDHALAPEAVAHVAEEHGAEHHAQQVGGDDVAQGLRRDAPFLRQARRGEGQQLQVEAIAEQRDQQQAQHQPGAPGHLLPVDQVVDPNRVRIRHCLRPRYIL